MDVRAKQRLCYQRRPLLLAGLVAVSPHVISAVSRFVVKSDEHFNIGVIHVALQRPETMKSAKRNVRVAVSLSVFHYPIRC
jgi:hypothetical protein